MMWALAIKRKITAALLLLAVVGLVLLTNWSEQRNAKRIAAAVTTIYEDRLVVEGYIFRLSQHLQTIGEIIDDDGSAFANKQRLLTTHLDDINKINALYAATKLTRPEEDNFNRFAKLCQSIQNDIRSGDYQKAKTAAEQAENILGTLSVMQMEEAKRQMGNVTDISNFSNLISKFELIILIVIAVLIQILVFSSPASTLTKPGRENLN